MIKNIISELNHSLKSGEISIECTERLLNHLSILTGKKYGILNKRVVYFEVDGMHDAWANA